MDRFGRRCVHLNIQAIIIMAMAEVTFSDISSTSERQNNFDYERDLFSGHTLCDSPSLTLNKASNNFVETKCSNKSGALSSGSFMKGLERFERELSFEESVYDIYSASDEYLLTIRGDPLKNNTEILSKYVVNFSREKPSKKAASRSKDRRLPLCRKPTFQTLSTEISQPLEEYFPSSSALKTLQSPRKTSTLSLVTAKSPSKSSSKQKPSTQSQRSVSKKNPVQAKTANNSPTPKSLGARK